MFSALRAAAAILTAISIAATAAGLPLVLQTGASWLLPDDDAALERVELARRIGCHCSLKKIMSGTCCCSAELDALVNDTSHRKSVEKPAATSDSCSLNRIASAKNSSCCSKKSCCAKKLSEVDTETVCDTDDAGVETHCQCTEEQTETIVIVIPPRIDLSKLLWVNECRCASAKLLDEFCPERLQLGPPTPPPERI